MTELQRPLANPQAGGVEDRRNEYDEIQHLLMQIGAWQPSHPDQGYRDAMGVGAGGWLNYDDPAMVLAPAGPLGEALGANDLDEQSEFARVIQTGKVKGR